MASEGATWNFTVTHGGKTSTVSCSPEESVELLQLKLDEAFGVSPDRQTILSKGVKITSSTDHSKSVKDAGLVDGCKLLLVGSTRDQIKSFKEKEEEAKREQEKRERVRQHAVRPRADVGVRTAQDFEHGFENIEALPNFGEANRTTQEAVALLKRLSQDRAILTIMRNYRWRVKLLKEFPPSLETGVISVTGSCLLGFNQNKGEVIGLRLRTDDMLGFRHYHIIISTLLHELVHMVHSEHDQDFHALNRTLNKEYESLKLLNEFGSAPGTDEPSLSIVETLGGTEAFRSADPRAMAARAALQRLEDLTRSSPRTTPGARSPATQRRIDDDDDSAANPYVYRPRRSLRVGAEYQAAIPDWQGPPGPSADAAPMETEVAVAAAAMPGVLGEATHETLLIRQRLDEFEKSDIPASSKVSCLQAIQQILLNILDNPKNEKFRCVKVKPTAFDGGAARTAAMGVLEAAGFTSTSVDGEATLLLPAVEEKTLLLSCECVALALGRWRVLLGAPISGQPPQEVPAQQSPKE